MKKKCVWLIACAACIGILAGLTACNKKEEIDVYARAQRAKPETVAEVIEDCEIIVKAKLIEIDDIVGKGNGVVTIGNTTFDDRSYYGQYQYLVEEVIQGDSSLAGETIIVREYLGVGENRYEPEPESTAGTERLLFVINDIDEECYYIRWREISRADFNKRGDVVFSDQIEDARKYRSLDAVQELVVELETAEEKDVAE